MWGPPLPCVTGSRFFSRERSESVEMLDHTPWALPGLKLTLLGLCALMAVTAVPWTADAQIYVYPRRPTQSNVRYFDFDWYHIDILVGPEADDGQAGFPGPDSTLEALSRSFPTAQGPSMHPRHPAHPDHPLFGAVSPDFYGATGSPGAIDFPDPAEDTRTQPPPPTFDTDDEEERPRTRFEPTDLDDRTGGVRLYYYDREEEVAQRAAAFIEESYRYLVEQFRHVPTRTLPYVLYSSYQEFLQTNIFPIQEGVLGVTGRRDLKLVLPYFGDHRTFQHISTHEMVHQFTIQKARDVVEKHGLTGDPLDRMPLWYIEGIAEYYSLQGLDPETEMLTRDLLLNPDPRRGYVMLDFFEDRPFSGLWTYKVGQARVAFLEEVYGEGTVQEVLEQSHLLLTNRIDGSAPRTFRSLLVEITGDDARRISARFERWIKERSYSRFLDSEQDAAELNFFTDTRGIMQTMTTSPSGYLMLYRSINPETGRVRLYVTDVRGGRHRQVAADGSPGIESLHPVGPRNFALHDDRLAFIARTAGRDVLYVQEIRHTAERVDDAWRIRLRLGSRQSYPLGEYGVLAAESPTFSPDGSRLAFIGLDEQGQKDVYVFDHNGDPTVRRLTNSIHAERGLTWGDDGIVYSSDATGHGYYNLFRESPDGDNTPERLTFEARDHTDPRILPDGRLFFSAYSASRSNLYELTADGIVRRTDIVTGLFGVSPAPGSALWATYHFRGQRRPVRITSEFLLDRPVEPAADLHPATEPATRDLDGAEPYRASQIGNWQLSNAFGILGASSGGVFGQLMLLTNDRLRNHAVFLNLLAFGDWNNTLFDLLYLNQEHRLIWGAGLFQDVRYRIDRSIESDSRFLSGERFYGARASLRYPLNRFAFVQGDLAAGGVRFFLQDFTRDRLPPGEASRWDENHAGHRFQVSPTLGLGYNTIQYHPGTGPISGTSLLLESTLDVQPFDDESHGTVRLDAERYFPIYNRINLGFRGGMGSTFGGELRRQFFLSSFDTLRGVEFGDIDYLLGDLFFFTKLELRFPLNFLVRIPLIDVEGIVGADFGGAGEDLASLWEWRAFSPVTGLNFGLGPIVFRLHFARPIDIGAPRLPNNGNWVTNFSLGWRYW